MQKSFIPLIVVVALAVLAVSGAAFVLTRTTGHGLQNYDIKSTNSEPANKQISDETANHALSGDEGASPELVEGWKTYRNEKYGFEVKYPADWIDDPRTMSSLGIKQGISDVSKNDNLSIVYEPQNSKCTEGGGCSYPAWMIVRTVKMSGESINTQASFREFVLAYRKKYLDDGADLSSKELVVDGRWAMEFSVAKKKNNPASVLVPPITLFIYHSPSTMIWIGVKFFDEYRDTVVPVFDQILSTFKFIPSTSP